jgi:hypothetical protein
MASLFEKAINDTYVGLIKTIDNLEVTSAVQLSDGLGTALPITISASTIDFGPADIDFTTSTVDFTNATVTGITASPDFDHLELNAATTFVVSAPAEIGWNATEGTFDMGMYNSVVLQAGQETHIYGKATEAIPNGAVVQFAGAQGSHILVKRAVQAEIAANPEYIIGIATQAFTNNQFGYVTAFGKVRGVVTTGLGLGTILWYDSEGTTPGAWTTTVPSNGYVKWQMAAITDEGPNGTIFVRPDQHFNLGELGNVTITSPTNGQVISYDATTSTWKNTTPSGGGGGLVSGTGPDSMVSDSSLTTTPATASGTSGIALGNGATSALTSSISIGSTATTDASGDIAIGNNARSIGGGAFARKNVVVGDSALSGSGSEQNVVLGASAQSGSNRTVTIGSSAQTTGARAIVVGTNSTASAFRSICIGAYSTASGDSAIVLGPEGSTASADYATAIGYNADATAVDAVAIGKDVTANITSTVSMKAIELQTNSTPTAGGIIMSDAGGTDRRLNLTSDGKLQVDNTRVGILNAYASNLRNPEFTGYASNTYWRTVKHMHGRGWSFNNGAIDQGAGTALMVPFDITEGVTVTTIGIPLFAVTATDTLEIAIYENNTTDNGPGARVRYESVPVTVADSQTIKEITLTTSFTPVPGKMYYVAAMTQGGSANAQLCYVSGDQTGFEMFTTTGSFGTVIPTNTMYYTTGGNLPAAFVATDTFGHRDECAFYCFK